MTGMLTKWIDIRPLRNSRQFRRLWIGTSAQSLGRQFTSIGVLYQVWDLTHDPFWTGFAGLTYAIPMIAAGLAGGTFADTLDRRKLVLWTTTGAFITSLLLVVQAFLELASLSLLLSIAAVQAGLTAFGNPARRTFVPSLLARDQVAAGIALTHASAQVAMLLGPALGGVLIAVWGVAFCYAMEAIAFCVAFYGIAGLPRMAVKDATEHRPLSGILDGLRFISSKPVLSGSFLCDLAATLMAMPVALFPAINQEKFEGNPEILGLFLSSIAAGGIIAVACSGWFTQVNKLGLVQLTAGAFWGIGLTGAALVDGLAATLLFLVVAGAADTVAVISRGTILQLATPDNFRGRVSSVEEIVGVAGPELGNFRAGLMATYISAVPTLAVGGILCVAITGVVATLNRSIRSFSQ